MSATRRTTMLGAVRENPYVPPEYHAMARHLISLENPLYMRPSLYLIAGSAQGPVKIGISANVAARCRALRSQTGQELFIYRQEPMPDMTGAAIVERAAHKALRCRRSRGEWFAVRVSEAIRACQWAVGGLNHAYFMAAAKRSWLERTPSTPRVRP